jgi:tight adherence protein C
MNQTLRNVVGNVGRSAEQKFGRVAENYIKKLNTLLIAAGEPGDLKGTELFGIQAMTVLVLPVVFGAILSQIGWFSFLFHGPKQALVYVGLMAVGFFFPVMNVRERAKKRQKTLALQLPDTLDLLTISVEAGLDFMGAMRRVVEKHRPGPLKDELERFFKQTELGRPRREALRDMANRAQLADLNAVVSALIQADRLGVSIGPALRVQSDMLRVRRGQRAEKAAHEAPVKMLAPLIICILPSVFIMILAPVFIQMLMDMAQTI